MPNGNAFGHLPQRLVKEEETQRRKTVFSFSISPGIADKLFDQMMRQFILFPFRIDTRIASTSPSSNSQMAWPISRKQPITHLSSVSFGHMAYAR